MYIQIIRLSFFLAVMSFALSNVHAMEPEEIVQIRKHPFYPLNKYWRIEEGNDQKHKAIININRRSKKIQHYKNIPLLSFTFRQESNGNTYIAATVDMPTSEKERSWAIDEGYAILKSIKDDIKPLKAEGNHTHITVLCTSEEASDVVFPSICKHYNFPYYLIYRLMRHTDIKGYKTPLEILTDRFNKQLKNESTEDDFKKIAYKELNHVGDLQLQSELTLGLAQHLADSKEHDNRQLIIDLCERITDKNLPCYGEARLLLGNQSYGDKSQDIETRYKKNTNVFFRGGYVCGN